MREKSRQGIAGLTAALVVMVVAVIVAVSGCSSGPDVRPGERPTVSGASAPALSVVPEPAYPQAAGFSVRRPAEPAAAPGLPEPVVPELALSVRSAPRPSLWQPALPLPDPVSVVAETAEEGRPTESRAQSRVAAAAGVPERPRAASPAASREPETRNAPEVAAKPEVAARPEVGPAPEEGDTAFRTGAAEPAPATQHLYAQPGDDVEVVLEGSGWLLLEQEGREVLGYDSRSHEAGRTVFVFSAADIGRARLAFLRQDPSGGPSERRRIEVSVVGAEEWSERAETAGIAAPRRETAAARIDALIAAGRSDEALELLREDYGTGSGFHNDRLAFVLETAGDLEEARNYWSRNAGSEAVDPALRGRAVAGLLRTATALKDPRGVSTALALLASVEGHLPTGARFEESLLDGAVVLAEEGWAPAALGALEAFLGRYPGSRRMGELYFRLGQVYETASELRDVRKSWRMYRIVSEEYPESPFAQDAELRARYLERHFLHLR